MTHDINVMTIDIRELRFPVTLGVTDEERVNKRDVEVNLSVEYDAARAVESDAISDALDTSSSAIAF